MKHLAVLCLALATCGCDDRAPVTEPTDGPTDDPGASPVQLASPVLLEHDADAPAAVQALALSPDGTTAVAAGWGGRVVALPLDGAASRALHQVGDGDLFMEGALAWSGDRVAVGTFSGLTLLDTGGAVIAALEGRTRAVIASGDGFLRTTRDEVQRVGPDGAIAVTSAVADPYAVVETSEAVFVLTSPDGVEREVAELDPATLSERRRWAAAGNVLFGSRDGTLATIVLDTVTLRSASGEPLGALPTDELPGDLVALSFAGSWVAGVGFAEGVAIFDVASRRLLARAGGATERGLVLDGDRRVIVGGDDGVLVYAIER